MAKLYNTSTIIHFVGVALFILWYIAFLTFGISSLILDSSVKQDSCGKNSSSFKEALLNVLFAAFTLFTFVVFPGGGEGARARALLVLLLHFALVVWGHLLWRALSPTCHDVILAKHELIYSFHVTCFVHNALFFPLYAFHELYLGHRLGGDLTLMPEVHMGVGQNGSHSSSEPTMVYSKLKYSGDSPTHGVYSQKYSPPHTPRDVEGSLPNEPPLHAAPELLATTSTGNSVTERNRSDPIGDKVEGYSAASANRYSAQQYSPGSDEWSGSPVMSDEQSQPYLVAVSPSSMHLEDKTEDDVREL